MVDPSGENQRRLLVYITKNGDTDLVIMDAAAFEEAMELHELAYKREMMTLEGIMKGRDTQGSRSR